MLPLTIVAWSSRSILALMIASSDGAVKIYGQKIGGSWKEKATISHNHRVNSASLSADGRHVLIVDYYNEVMITELGSKDDGSYKHKTR